MKRITLLSTLVTALMILSIVQHNVYGSNASPRTSKVDTTHQKTSTTLINAEDTRPAHLKTDLEKTIYTIGQRLAWEVEPFQLSDEELKTLESGFWDRLKNREPKVDVARYRDEIMALLTERVQKISAAEREKGQKLLAEEQKATGAVVTDSGIVKRVLRKGEGPQPEKKNTVKVHYKGMLADGQVIADTQKNKAPVNLPLSRCMPCWQETLESMHVGEKVRIGCPADLAYGDRGSVDTVIPPGAAIIYEMELLGIVN